MTTIPPLPAPPGPSRGWRVVLAVSLALNLGVAGIIGGMILHGGPGRHGDMVRELGFGPFTEAMRPEDRAALRARFLQKAPDLRAERQEMQADAGALLAALRATPFDAAALEQAMQTQTQHLADRLDLGRALLQEFLVSLSPEARFAFADRLEERLRHGPGPSDAGN